MTAVFLVAAPRVRTVCPPDLIEGFEVDIKDGAASVEIYALRRAPGYQSAEPEDAPDEDILVGRWTGRMWRDLPLWEVDRP